MTPPGSAVYVFGILAYTIKGPVGNSDLSFYVDGDLVGTFNFTPPGEDTYSYNTILYANDSLDHASHALTLQNGRAGVHESLILLDYIIYSTYVYSYGNVSDVVADIRREESPLSGQQSSSQQSTLSIGTSLNPPTPFTSPVSQLTHALPSSSVQSPTTRAFPSAHTTTRTIVLSTLLPTLLLLPALILAFVCHRRRRRLQLALRPTALAYDSFLSPGCSSPSKSRSTIVAALHRTTQYARNSQGIWTRIRGESACGDEGTGVSAALGTVESTEPSTPASSQCTAVEDVRVRQKIYAEIDRSNRHAAERRAQRGERRSGIMSS